MPAAAFLLSGIAPPGALRWRTCAAGADVVGHAFFRGPSSRSAEKRSGVAASGGRAAAPTPSSPPRRTPCGSPDPSTRPCRCASCASASRSTTRGCATACWRGRRGEERIARARRWRRRPRGLVASVVRPLPRGAALAFGRALGRLLGDLDRRHVAIAATTCAAPFPTGTRARAARRPAASTRHFGAVLLDILWLAGRPPRGGPAPCRRRRGASTSRAALAAGRGVVLVTAHVGNWELPASSTGGCSGRSAWWRARSTTPPSTRGCAAFRARTGNTVIYKRRALAQVLRLLRGRQARRDPHRPERAGGGRHLRRLLRPQGRDHHGGRGPRREDRLRAGARPRELADRTAATALSTSRRSHGRPRATGRRTSRASPSA